MWDIMITGQRGIISSDVLLHVAGEEPIGDKEQLIDWYIDCIV